MSINLTATNQSLELVLSTTTGADCVVSGRDNLSGAQTPMSQDTTVAATTSTIVTAPAASHQVMVDDVEISITAVNPVTVKVQKNTGGTLRQLFPTTVFNPNERLHYTNDQGWRAFTASGRERGIPVGYAQMAASTLITATGAYTYQPPVGCTALLIEAWSGSGQGGGSGTGVASQVAVGSAGNSGGYSRKFLIGPPSSITGSVGAAGSGAAGTANGNAGGQTTVVAGSLTITVPGGTGGGVGTAGTTVAETAPTALGAVPTGGDENYQGQQGDAGIRFSGSQGLSGQGGEPVGGIPGNPGRRSVVAGVGAAATGIGAGGASGMALTATNFAGGAGDPGCVRFTPYSG